MKLNGIFTNFGKLFNSFFNNEKTKAPEPLPEKTIINNLKYITGEQLFSIRKEQYKSLYTAYITNLLLENGVNPTLANNPKISLIINDKIGLYREQINKLKEEIDLYEEYQINEIQNTFDLNENETNLIKKYISSISVEKDGSLIQMPSKAPNALEKYEVFNQGVMCTKEYSEKDEKNHGIVIKEVINPNGKYIARHTEIIEKGNTINGDYYTKKTTIDTFKEESYAKEGFYITDFSSGKEKILENFGQSCASIDSNVPYTKENVYQKAKQLYFNNMYVTQNNSDINSNFIYKIKQNITRNFAQTEAKNPQKYYVTDAAKKYFDTEECFENKAAQLLDEYRIEHELDN